MNLDIPAKMIVYFDAETCASCALSRIWEWDEVSHITQSSNGKFQTLFIFTPKQKDLQTVKRIFQGMHMENRLVYVDGNAMGMFMRAGIYNRMSKRCM